jgi:hypothetical protein
LVAACGLGYVNLNFDMVGSPNYARFVYDGDGSATSVAGPPGSDAIEKIFTDYLDSKNLASKPTAFDGCSDYDRSSMSASRLADSSAAEGIKTDKEAQIYGRTTDVAYDGCYHKACDAINNLNTAAPGGRLLALGNKRQPVPRYRLPARGICSMGNVSVWRWLLHRFHTPLGGRLLTSPISNMYSILGTAYRLVNTRLSPFPTRHASAIPWRKLNPRPGRPSFGTQHPTQVTFFPH